MLAAPPSPHTAALVAALFAAAAILALRGPRPAVRRVRYLVQAPHQPRWQPLLEAARQKATAFAAVVLARRTRRLEEDRLRAAVISLCDGLAAELTAGRPPAAALSAALSVLDPGTIAFPEPDSLHLAQPNPDPADFLEAAAARPGADGLRLLAACWRIGAERGGSFASVVDGLATTLRDEQAHRDEVAGQLAGPRATARLLAILPLLGLAMAAALGAHPIAFLLGTWPGFICLVLGAALDIAGLTWTRRIADSAEQPR
jgi:tight adherence protein B